jgi:hypothetical protein
MSDDASAGSAAGPIDIVQIPTTGDNAVMSTRAAAQALAAARHAKKPDSPTEPQPAPQERPIEAAPEQATQSGDEPDATAAAEQPPGDETAEADRAEQPPIEPPRSWTKEARERFASLPRETQEYLADREQERDRELRRSQNEAAEKLKGLTAKEQAAEQERAKYEQLVPQALALMQQQHNAKFPDIRTTEDVTKMAAEDWPRYVMWDAEQKRLASAQYEAQQISQRQTQEKQAKLSEFEQAQAKLFAEKVPEFADPAKKTELQNKAIDLLKSHLGFTDAELGEIYNSDKGLSLRDHRTQLLLLDGIKYREAKAAGAKPAPKPVPPVQRPGASQSRGTANGVEVQNLAKRLDQSSGINALRNAAQLLQARRASR